MQLEAMAATFIAVCGHLGGESRCRVILRGRQGGASRGIAGWRRGIGAADAREQRRRALDFAVEHHP